MSDDPTTGGDSELRKRAAWLFGMLIVVAALVVVVMTTLLKSDNGSSSNGDQVGPDPITSTGPAAPTHKAEHSTPATHTPTTSGSSSGSAVATDGPATCPTSATCALSTDVGGGVAAVNAYRAQHGKAPVSGAVTDAAKQCALHRGSGCTGGWAETEIPAPANGTVAVNKISVFAHLLDPMKSLGVGWAYDPGSKTYYFVTIRKT